MVVEKRSLFSSKIGFVLACLLYTSIIKIAMNRVQKALEEKKYVSKLVLQVHDELILYAKEEELEEVTELLRDCMENAMKLSVPLRVNIARGKTWAEAK